MVENILIVGVGGQGILLASRVLATLALQQGFDVKVSEVHGMAQRGGSVVTHLRFGDEVHSPLIEKGDADYLVAFEKLEAIRWFPYLRQEGTVFVNEQEINPAGLYKNASGYPRRIKERMQEAKVNSVWVDALTLAQKAGSSKAVNLVLLGVLSNYLPFTAEQWDMALRESIPEKILRINQEAFSLGRDASKHGASKRGQE